MSGRIRTRLPVAAGCAAGRDQGWGGRSGYGQQPVPEGGRLTGMMTPTRYAHTRSPLGRLLLTGTGAGLSGLYLADHDRAPSPGPDWLADPDGFAHVRDQLGEYFAGVRTRFEIEVDLDGTDVQRQVWAALRAIPYGRTISYRELAVRIGRPTASRAVGTANANNPVSIIVPCHRVIAADGTLGGYAWGLARKAWLLDLENGQPPSASLPLVRAGDSPSAAACTSTEVSDAECVGFHERSDLQATDGFGRDECPADRRG